MIAAALSPDPPRPAPARARTPAARVHEALTARLKPWHRGPAGPRRLDGRGRLAARHPDPGPGFRARRPATPRSHQQEAGSAARPRPGVETVSTGTHIHWRPGSTRRAALEVDQRRRLEAGFHGGSDDDQPLGARAEIAPLASGHDTLRISGRDLRWLFGAGLPVLACPALACPDGGLLVLACTVLACTVHRRLLVAVAAELPSTSSGSVVIDHRADRVGQRRGGRPARSPSGSTG